MFQLNEARLVPDGEFLRIKRVSSYTADGRAVVRNDYGRCEVEATRGEWEHVGKFVWIFGWRFTPMRPSENLWFYDTVAKEAKPSAPPPKVHHA